MVWLNEQGVDITLIRFRPYQLATGQVMVTFTRTYPVPTVEEFTIGRRTAQAAESVDPGPGAPWDPHRVPAAGRAGQRRDAGAA